MATAFTPTLKKLRGKPWKLCRKRDLNRMGFSLWLFVLSYLNGRHAVLGCSQNKTLVPLAIISRRGNNPRMEIHEWDKRYRLREHAASDLESPPTPLLIETAKILAPGRALDLACGAGRNALWLAEHGWDVIAVDGSSE